MKEDMIKDTDEILQVQGETETDESGIRETSATVEEIALDDDASGFEWWWINNHSLFMKIGVPMICLLISILILITAGISSRNAKKEPAKETYVSSMPDEEMETAEDETQETDTEDTQTGAGTVVSKDNTAIDRLTEELDEMQEQLTEAKNSLQSLHDAIFGETGQGASLGCVTAVTGFTDREKREIGFLESDFLKDIGAFLAGQQIQTKRIIIEDRIAGSSSAAVAFQGRLEGKDDYILDVVFYPDLPGEDICLLRNVKGNERGADNQAAGDAAGQNTAQETQSSAAPQTVQETPPSSQNTENTQDQQNAYDATALAVKKIPETLLNYIDNRYEFQYSLYNWLYNHGKKNVESATVTDYSIDGDARQAVIDLQLSDGSGMTAVYDKSANSYSFER